MTEHSPENIIRETVIRTRRDLCGVVDSAVHIVRTMVDPERGYFVRGPDNFVIHTYMCAQAGVANSQHQMFVDEIMKYDGATIMSDKMTP